MKKKIFIILILPAIAIVTGYFLRETFATSNPHTWDTGLVGYWNFDGQNTTSTGTRDMSDEDNWGSINGAIPKVGIVGQGMYFDGSNDYAEVGYDSSLDITSSFTYEVWFNTPISLTAQNDWSAIMGQSKITGGVVETHYIIAGNGEFLRCGFRTEAEGESSVDTTGFTPTIGKWHHIVYVFDDSADKLQVYVDGVFNNETTSVTAVPGSPTHGVDIGRLRAGNNGTGLIYFNGTIDEVRIYNRALSADEIMQHYEQTRRNLKL